MSQKRVISSLFAFTLYVSVSSSCSVALCATLSELLLRACSLISGLLSQRSCNGLSAQAVSSFSLTPGLSSFGFSSSTRRELLFRVPFTPRFSNQSTALEHSLVFLAFKRHLLIIPEYISAGVSVVAVLMPYRLSESSVHNTLRGISSGQAFIVRTSNGPKG